MTDTQTHWHTIHQAWSYAVAAIPRSSQPSDGQPTGTNDPRKSPVNDTAQSWCAEVEQMVFGWTPNTYTPFATPLNFLTYRFDHEDVQNQYEPTAITEELLPQLERLAREATRFIPAHIQTRQLTPEHTSGKHCTTIEELAWVLNSLGKPKPQSTLRRWASEGWLTKTPAGYPINQALERINK